MSHCPRCHQPITAQTVKCPHCRLVLKAYGHPGITLHRATQGDYLCESCAYHADDTCTFPQRPYAKECTLYEDINQPQLNTEQLYVPRRNSLQSLKLWCQNNPALLALFTLIGISLGLAVLSQ